jgi:predicted permease
MNPLDRRDREIREEIRFHLEERARELEAQGYSPEEARGRARQAFGDPEKVVMGTLEQWGVRELESRGAWARRLHVIPAVLSSFWRNVRYGARSLIRSPGFTMAAALTLAIGIGASTAVFTLVDAILIRPLPYADADRLVSIRHVAPGLDLADAGLSDGTYLHYQARNRVFGDIATYHENVVNLTGNGDAERVPIAMVTPTLFSLLGARAAAGRLPIAQERAAEGEVLVLISHDLWTRRYGADPDLVGSTIEANGRPRRVIGVLEPGFDFPRPEIAIWYPTPAESTGAGLSDLTRLAVARLRPGVTLEQAEADLNRLIPSLSEAFPDATAARLEESGLRAVVEPLKERFVGSAASSLWTLLGAMGFLTLITLTNVANLFLARAEHRQKESAVRAAIGASRLDVVGPVLAEGVLLGVASAAFALLLADGGVRALVAFGPHDVPRLHEVRVGPRVAAFSGLLGVLAGLVFGLVNALRTQPSITVSLKDGSRGLTSGREQHRARRALVAGQIALALTLMIGSALMFESFWRLRKADPGFQSEGLLTAEVALPFNGYETYDRAYALWDRVLERLRANPAVEAAGAVSTLPLVPVPPFWNDQLTLERGFVEAARPTVTFLHVTPGYFEAMGIPVRAGALPWSRGAASPERPVVISEHVAGTHFVGSALGEGLRRGTARGDAWNRVAAVVGDVPAAYLAGGPAAVVYLPLLEASVDNGWIPSHMTLVLRTSANPESLAPVIREVVSGIDPNLPVANVRSMERIVAASMARVSFAMVLLLIAAASALLLGTVGVYGVTSYVISRRRQEVGIRIALGARREDVQRMLLGDGARVAAVGIVAGTTTALLLTRFLRSLLYQVSEWDPVAFALTALLLLATVLLATWLPASKAARTDPLVALRAE